MRGRTVEDAVVILDEAQNATANQLKMFLTSLGCNSRMVVAGMSLRDLLAGSGLVEVPTILSGVHRLCRTRFRRVVRHPLVGRIAQSYEATRVAEELPFLQPGLIDRETA